MKEAGAVRLYRRNQAFAYYMIESEEWAVSYFGHRPRVRHRSIISIRFDCFHYACYECLF